MDLDEYPDITDYMLKAVGKTYITYIRSNPTRDMTLFMETVIEIIAEFSDDAKAHIGRLLAKMMEDKRNE